jgi:hypothetical protein
MYLVELRDRIGVRIDAEYAAVVESLLVPAPVKIEAPRMRVDLDGGAIPGADLPDFIEVDVVAVAAVNGDAWRVRSASQRTGTRRRCVLRLSRLSGTVNSLEGRVRASPASQSRNDNHRANDSHAHALAG